VLGELSSISARVNHRANQIIAIKQITTESGEGWCYEDYGAMLNVLLSWFKLTSVAKGRCIKIGIALDAAPLTKTLSVFTVSIVICDPDAIYPNRVLK
jgi:hypothetical protein